MCGPRMGLCCGIRRTRRVLWHSYSKHEDIALLECAATATGFPGVSPLRSSYVWLPGLWMTCRLSSICHASAARLQIRVHSQPINIRPSSANTYTSSFRTAPHRHRHRDGIFFIAKGKRRLLIVRFNRLDFIAMAADTNVPAADGAALPASSNESAGSAAPTFSDREVEIMKAAFRSLAAAPQVSPSFVLLCKILPQDTPSLTSCSLHSLASLTTSHQQ